MVAIIRLCSYKGKLNTIGSSNWFDVEISNTLTLSIYIITISCGYWLLSTYLLYIHTQQECLTLRTWIFTSFFQKQFFSITISGYYSILWHTEQCLFPSPQNAFCFTNLSLLVLETFRFFEYYVQNLNTPQKNSASWDLQMGFNSAFKGLICNEKILTPYV